MIDIDDYMKYEIIHDEYDDYEDDDSYYEDEDFDDDDDLDIYYEDKSLEDNSNCLEDDFDCNDDNNECEEDDDGLYLEYQNDMSNELYYTKSLLEKFPELKKDYSVKNWDAPLFIIKDIAQKHDFESVIKYLDYLINIVDYEFLSKANNELLRRLSLSIVDTILSEIKDENNDIFANYLFNNSRLFDIIFKYCDWGKYGLIPVLYRYMRFCEKVKNVEQETIAYNSFLLYQKKNYTIDELAYFWNTYYMYDAPNNEKLYQFYKNSINYLGEKGNRASDNLKRIMGQLKCSYRRKS